MGRGLGCHLDLGSSNRVLHILEMAKNIGADSTSRDPIALQPSIHRWVGFGDSCDRNGRTRGVAGLGLVQGHWGLGWAGSAHVWGGAPTGSLGVTCP